MQRCHRTSTVAFQHPCFSSYYANMSITTFYLFAAGYGLYLISFSGFSKLFSLTERTLLSSLQQLMCLICRVSFSDCWCASTDRPCGNGCLLKDISKAHGFSLLIVLSSDLRHRKKTVFNDLSLLNRSILATVFQFDHQPFSSQGQMV